MQENHSHTLWTGISLVSGQNGMLFVGPFAAPSLLVAIFLEISTTGSTNEVLYYLGIVGNNNRNTDSVATSFSLIDSNRPFQTIIRKNVWQTRVFSGINFTKTLKMGRRVTYAPWWVTLYAQSLSNVYVTMGVEVLDLDKGPRDISAGDLGIESGASS